MFEEYVGLLVKCVFSDSGNNKAVQGILKKIDGNFLLISTNNGNLISINANFVLSVKEVRG